MNNHLVILIIMHAIASMIVSARGPVYTRDSGCLTNLAAYIISLMINLCGFWPITVIMILRE